MSGLGLLSFDLPTFKAEQSAYDPTLLYHYTTQEGLLGIVEHSTLFASKVQYMNDATEFGLAFEVAKDRNAAFKGKTTDSGQQAKIIELEQNFFGSLSVNIFVACFCEQGDLLSQWRAYSGENRGFSIGIKSATLRTATKPLGFALGRCIYDSAIQSRIVDEVILCATALPLTQCATRFNQNLVAIAAFFKHHRFSEEREWRLVSQVTNITEDRVAFRPGKSMIIPYFKLPLKNGKEHAIDGAIVGPSPHPNLSKHSVEMLFVNADIETEGGALSLRGPKVRVSEIPFRNW